VFTDPETYPLSEMIDAGLRVAITTDDPSIFNTTLSDEHAFVIEQLGFSIETIKGLTLQALQLSFIDDKKRRTLEKSIAKNFWENEE
jgi:adenosine deaminase